MLKTFKIDFNLKRYIKPKAYLFFISTWTEPKLFKKSIGESTQ